MKSAQSDVMVDLETLGNGPRSVIVSIGAVFFGDGQIGEEFYSRVDPETCVRAGLVMDADTVLWWMGQSFEARSALIGDGAPALKDVLGDFAWFIGARGLGGVAEQVRVWGNGAAFDNVILGSAYRALRAPQPWKFWNDRCYRTIKELNRHVPLAKRSGTHHNAVDDARSQAEHLMEIFAQPRSMQFATPPASSRSVGFWRRIVRRIAIARRAVQS